MQKVRVTMTISPSVNKLIEDYAGTLQLSKSALVERILQDHLRNQLKKDAKKLSKIKFDDLPTEDEWIEIMPTI